MGAPVRSVVDVPFAYGTLAVNSTEANAFDEVDIEILRDMAGALDEGFRRKDDLKRLEEAVAALQKTQYDLVPIDIQMPGNDFISKPIRPAELSATLERWLGELERI